MPTKSPYAEETARLGELRAALWSAFEAGIVPASLVDLTMVYTSALRLELSLATWPKRVVPRLGATGPPLKSGV